MPIPNRLHHWWVTNKENFFIWLLSALAAASAAKSWETNEDQTFLILVGLAGSIVWRPAVCLAVAGSCALLLTPPKNPPETIILVGWLIWSLYQLFRKEKTGLENSLTGPLIGLGAIWITASQTATLASLGTLALTAAMINAGHKTRAVIGLTAILLALSPTFRDAHKNTKGRLLNSALLCLVITPGPVGKAVALIPTHYNLTHPEAAAAKATTILIWLAWLLGKTWEKIPKNHRKKAMVSLGVITMAALGSSPMWIPTIIGALGKSTTLTGRTPLWMSLKGWIEADPWNGYGNTFWAFYGNQTTYLNNLWPAGSAHNGILELWLTYGAGGVLIGVLTVAASALHKANSPKSTLPSLASWATYISEVIHISPGLGGPWAIITSAAQGEKEAAPSKKPTRKLVGLLLGISLIWASGCLLLLPKSSSKYEELWIGQSTDPEWCTGKNKTEHVKLLIAEIKAKRTNVEAHHLEDGLTFVVRAPEKQEVEALAQVVRKNHTFLRTLPKTFQTSYWKRNVIFALFPLVISCLVLLKNNKRTGMTIILLGSAYLLACSSLPPEPVEAKVEKTRIPSADWNETPTFPKFWSFLLRENLQGKLLGRILSTPTQKAIVRTKLNTDKKRELYLQFPGQDENEKLGEVDITDALYQSEQILKSYGALEPKMPRNTEISPQAEPPPQE